MTTWQLIKYSLAKLLYEMVGTYLFAMLFICRSAPFPVFLGLWIVTSFCIRISGAHFNPAISFAFSLRKDTGGLPRKLAITFILAQVLGAMLAGLTCLWILPNVPAAEPFIIKWYDPIKDEWHHTVDNTFRDMIAEFAGSFCFTFFYLSQSEEKTVISSIETIHCFVLAAAYVTARTIVRGNGVALCNYGAILNPAIAIGIFFSAWFNDFGAAWKYVWLYPVFPLFGAVAAIFFFEFVYKKTQEMLNDHDRNSQDEPAPTKLEQEIDQ